MSAAVENRIAFYPFPRQERMIRCPADEIFFGGGRGPGKTLGVLLKWWAFADRWGPDAKGLLLRRTLKGLTDVESKAKEVFGKVYPVRECWKDQKKEWQFPNGAILRLNYLDSEDDVLQYQGHEYGLILPDELTQWKDERNFELLIACNRSSNPEIHPQIIATGNPGGPGHLWVKKRFIDIAPPETIVTVEKEHGGKVYTRTRCFIPALLTDNPVMMATNYASSLASLSDKLRKMYLEGCWDVVEGAFFDEWDAKVHTTRYFYPDPSWKRSFAFDWGYDAPYAGVWMAESPSGLRYIYREIYGYDEERPSKGVRRPAKQVAQEIRAIEAQHGEHIQERWVDGSIFDEGGTGRSDGDLFADEGVFFQKVNKREKKHSISLFRQDLAVINGACRLRIMDNCRNLIRTIPALETDPANPEQYDTDGEDHLADACCYLYRGNLSVADSLLMLGQGKKSYGTGGWR